MELFIHTPGNEHPEIIEIEATAQVRELLVEGDADGHIWIEEVDEEITSTSPSRTAGIRHHHHVHRGHCHRVEVVVRFNGNFEHTYGPATTIKTVEKWAFGPEVANFSEEQARSARARRARCGPLPRRRRSHRLAGQAGLVHGDPRPAAPLPVRRMTTVVMAPDERALHVHLARGTLPGRGRRRSLAAHLGDLALASSSRCRPPSDRAARRIRAALRAERLPAYRSNRWAVGRRDRQLAARRAAAQGRAAQPSSSGPTVGPAAQPPCTPPGIASASSLTPAGPRSTRLQAWNPTRDLSFILANVHEVLNADDYLGI